MTRHRLALILMASVLVLAAACDNEGKSGPAQESTVEPSDIIEPHVPESEVPALATVCDSVIRRFFAPPEAAAGLNLRDAADLRVYSERSAELRRQHLAQTIQGLPVSTHEFVQSQGGLGEDLIELIRLAVGCRENLLARYRTEFVAPISILQDVSSADWYADGLTTQERWHVENLYRTYLDLANLKLGTSLKIGDPAAMIRSSLASGTVEWLERPLSQRTLIALSDDQGRSRQAFDIAKQYLLPIEQFAGVLQPAGIALLVVSLDRRACGLTKSYLEAWHMQFVLVDPACLRAATVTHEIVHAYLGGRYPTWYTEGIAMFLSHRAIGTLDEEASRLLALEQTRPFLIDLDKRYGIEPRAVTQYFAGLLFLREVSLLLGEDTLRAAVRNLRPEANGQRILDELRSRTPVDKAEALENLIRARVTPEP